MEPLTNWAVDEHATHQDPGLLADGACASLVAGLPADVDAEAVRDACTRRLTVANQRGYCVPNAPNSCVSAQPGYSDACDQLNDKQLRSGCEGVDSP